MKPTFIAAELARVLFLAVLTTNWVTGTLARAQAVARTPYLQNLTVTNPCLIGGGTTTATVSLSSPATAATIVKLRYQSPLTGPATVTVPTNATATTFSVSAPQLNSLTALRLVATLSNWAQEEYIAVAPNSSALAPQFLRASTGQGAVLLHWQGLPAELERSVVAGYRVQRRRGTVTETLGTQALVTDSFLDVSASTGSVAYSVQTISPSGATVAQSAWLDVAVASGVPSVAAVYIDPTSVSGIYNLHVPASDYNGGTEQGTVYRGGCLVSFLSMPRSESGDQVVTSEVDLTATGGPEPLFVCYESQSLLRVSASIPVDYVGSIGDRSESIFETDRGDVGHIESAFGADVTRVRCDIVSPDGIVVRSWTGTGGNFRVAWDGATNTGATADTDEYDVRITAYLPGGRQIQKHKTINLWNNSPTEDQTETSLTRRGSHCVTLTP